MTETIIELQSIRKVFRTEFVETTAVRDVSMTIKSGDFVCLTGPSGCGKSTLLHILGLLHVPTAGKYILDGQDVSSLTFDQRASVRNKTLGFLFQSFNLLDDLSVLGNVLLPVQYAEKFPVSNSKSKAEDLLKRVGLSHRLDHKPSQLSGGQQQRVALARSLIMQPKVLLLDEPTGNLDTENSQSIVALLEELNQSGTTIVLVSHEGWIAERARTSISLRDGAVVASN